MDALKEFLEQDAVSPLGFNPFYVSGDRLMCGRNEVRDIHMDGPRLTISGRQIAEKDGIVTCAVYHMGTVREDDRREWYSRLFGLFQATLTQTRH